MKKEFFKINNIPAILWGDNSKNLIIAIHGNMSFKEDIPIKILAEIALEKNYQVLSFDLPEHGKRKNEKTLCKVKENPITKWNCPTYILYGEKDNLCEKNIITEFTNKFNCNLSISKESEHWFHTENDLKILKEWIEKIL